MKNRNKWIDLREPPQSLIDLAFSEIREFSTMAAKDLAHYAHKKSVEVLVHLLEHEYIHTRDSAIYSLKKILPYEHLSEYRVEISAKIIALLADEKFRHSAVNFLSENMYGQLEIDAMFRAIMAQIGLKIKINDANPYYIQTMFESFNDLGVDDSAYVARKIVTLNLVSPGISPYVIREALKCLYRKAAFSGIAYSIYHLSGKKGYETDDYKFYPKQKGSYQERYIVSEAAVEIIRDAALKQGVENSFLKEQIDLGLECLINSSCIRNDPIGHISFNAVCTIVKKNPDYIKSLPTKIYNSLPQPILERLKSP